MGRDKEGKRSKKGIFALILAAIGAAVMVFKRRKSTEEPGWEEAKTDVS
ncbi:MAG: hypothetical protein ACXVQY_00020 [Actinomycetota bacterium]